MTTWIIHTAGDADLGLPGHGDEESRRQWRDQRLRQVRHASTRELTDLLGLLTWRDRLPRANDAVAAPLVSILTGYSGPAPTVLLVGTRGGHPLDTYPIAETLAGAIADVPDLYGRPATARAVAAAAMDEDAVCAAVGEALRDATRDDEVVVAWGSGATLVALGAMAAVTERRLTWWLALTGRDGQRHDLVPEDSPDRLVPWLLRLRYPDAVLETFGRRPEVVGPDKLEVVARLAERRRAGLLARDRDAVAALVLDAIARPDGTAGLAVRRYIDLEYRNRLEPGNPNRLDWAERQLRKDNEGGQPVLGACLEYIKRKRGRELSPSTRWLRSDPVDALNDVGKASHNLKRPTARQLARLEPEFADYVDELDADRVAAGLPRIPALPARTVLAVWPVGTGGKYPIGPELLGQELPHDLLAFLGADSTSRKPHLRCVLLGTTGPAGSLPVARTQAESASWLPGWFATARAEALAVDAAEPVFATDPAEVDRQVSAWLRAQDDRLVDVGAVVLIPVGAKPLNDGALLALQRWTLDRGLPFYLRSHHKGSGPPRHFLLPARLAGDRMLAGVALWALHRLEYETAARLLRAGSTDLTGCAERCEQLGRAFRRDRGNDPWPDGSPRTTCQRGAGLASARVALVRDRLDNEADEAEAVRLLHLAYTLLEASIDSADADRWFESRIRSCAPLDLRTLPRSGTDDDARQVVYAMRTLRNALPTSHPDGDLRLHEIIEREVGEATRYRLRAAKRLPTPAELVEAFEWALRQTVWEGWPSRSRPDRRLLDLDRQLAADLTPLAAEPE